MRDDRFYSQTAAAVADYLWQELQIHPRRDYRIASATSGPRVLTLCLVLNPRHAPKVASLAEQLSMAAALDKEAAIRIARGNRGILLVEIPKPSTLCYSLPLRALPRHRGLKAPIGIDGEHRPALVNFSDPLTPHVLAAGTTGSGKTNTARLLVYDLAAQNAPEDVRLILVDTRKRGAAWRPFEHLPHLAHPVIIEDGEALRALSWAVAEVDRRATERRARPRVFICIDEAQVILDRPEFVKAIGDLAATGREFGIHLVLATQNPTASQLGDTSIKRNLTTRLVGKVDSAQAATVAAGIGGTGAELLTGAGDQLLIQPSGTKRITAALVSEHDTEGLPAAEEVGRLALEEYEDVDHVRAQADVAGLEPAHLAYCLAYPDESQRALYERWHVGFPRIKRIQTLAREVLDELAGLGFGVCNAATVQQPDEEENRNAGKRYRGSVALQLQRR